MATPETTQPGADEVARAAARAIAPTDPEIQALLARKALGEKLQPAEYGKLGQFKAKQIRSGALPVAPSQSVAAAPGQTQQTTLPLETPDGGAPLSPSDSAFVSRTVDALLTSLNAIGQRHLVAQARIVATNAQKAGVPAPNVARFETADVVSPAHKSVMVETAPLVCEAFGVNPRHVPIGAFFGSAGLVGLDFYTAMTELKEINATITEKLKAMKDAPSEVAKPAQAAPAVATKVALPPGTMREQPSETPKKK